MLKINSLNIIKHKIWQPKLGKFSYQQTSQVYSHKLILKMRNLEDTQYQWTLTPTLAIVLEAKNHHARVNKVKTKYKLKHAKLMAHWNFKSKLLD